MRSICRDDDMPDMVTVFRWLRIKEEFRKQYETAKEESADALIEDMLGFADESAEVIIGNDKSDSARVQAKRLQVDTRKWAASKLKPKKYGDKLDLTSDGKALPTPILGSTQPV